jgi:hypothetical protein
MWVDYDVPNWFVTSKNFYNTAQIQHCSISKVAFNKFWWYRTMLNFYPPFLCRVLAAILKMADILKIFKTQNCSSNGYYSAFFPCTMNLSTADLRNYMTEFHETWWSYRNNLETDCIWSPFMYCKTCKI